MQPIRLGSIGMEMHSGGDLPPQFSPKSTSRLRLKNYLQIRSVSGSQGICANASLQS